MLSDCGGGRGLWPDPPSPTGVNLLPAGRESQPQLHRTKIAITEIKALKLCRNHNLKDLLSE